jgi:hypothetical protein
MISEYTTLSIAIHAVIPVVLNVIRYVISTLLSQDRVLVYILDNCSSQSKSSES